MKNIFLIGMVLMALLLPAAAESSTTVCTPPGDADDIPVIQSVKLNNSTPIAGNPILVTVNATDDSGVAEVDANGIDLSIVGDSTVTWSGILIAVPGNHSVNVSATDNSCNTAWNNSTSYNATASLTDTVPPVINSVALDNTTPRAGNPIKVTVNATDNVGVARVEANGAALSLQAGNTFTWSGMITAIEGNHSVNVSAKDASGNMAWNNSTSYNATAASNDTIPPVINSVTLDNSTPKTGSPIKVTVNATDNVGVVRVDANGIALALQSGNTFTWSGMIMAMQGNHSVNVSARDSANNIAWNNSTSYSATGISISNGSISGMKFNDSNGNGLKDAGEAGLSNWTIVLKNNTGSIIDIEMTGASGTYTFSGLAAGTFTVEEMKQVNWIQTFPKAPGTYNITLAQGGTITGIDFGNNFSQKSSSGVNASREIGVKSLRRGESTTIIVRINTNIIQPLSLNESIPTGWNITRIYDDADVFKNNTNEWMWSKVNPGTIKLVIYTITVPDNAPTGRYYINGTIDNEDGKAATVSGDNTIIMLDILEYYRKMGDDPNKVETTDLLKAMNDWRNGITPPEFAHPITNEELEELIEEWATS